ncbi:MAG: hypothetical protein HYZ59_00865, partial [Actinobacteria bacterium]|nr:hypothetical protein [Actinomycetota bacterium]
PLSQHHNERNRLLTLILHGSMRTVCAVLVRHLLVTGSYLRRDVLSPLLRGRPVRSESVLRRLRALGAALRLAPAMLMQRREGRLCGQMAIRPSDGDQIVT